MHKINKGQYYFLLSYKKELNNKKHCSILMAGNQD